MTDLRNITRVDNVARHTFGWIVRYAHNGVTRSRFYADRQNGGSDLALAKAIGWRDHCIATHRIASVVTKRPVRVTVVTRGVVRHYWQAQTGDRMNRKTRNFSIAKFGEDEARRMAQEWLDLSNGGLPA